MSTLGYFTSAYSALLDLFFALYPIPFVMRLNMALKPRIAVCTALGLSSLACVVSLYKLAIFNSVFKVLATDLTCRRPFHTQAYPPMLPMRKFSIVKKDIF